MKRIVTAFSGLWPRRVFDIHKGNNLVIKRHPELRPLLSGPGVYVLYQGDRPYYVGKTGRALFERLHDHANKTTDKFYELWNYFSLFSVPDRSQRSDVEGILIAAQQRTVSHRSFAKSRCPKTCAKCWPHGAGFPCRTRRHQEISEV